MRLVRTRDQPAEYLPASCPGRRRAGDKRRHDGVIAVRWPQVPAPVQAMAVVVHVVFIQDRPQMPGPGDQHPVGDLRPGGAYPSFGMRITPHRQLHPIRTIGTTRPGDPPVPPVVRPGLRVRRLPTELGRGPGPPSRREWAVLGAGRWTDVVARGRAGPVQVVPHPGPG